MTSHNVFASYIASNLEHSPMMRLASACLGGDRRWIGSARGLFGLINRDFTIRSIGAYQSDDLIFSEDIAFEDGETESRTWRLRDTEDGLSVEGPGIEQIRPAAFLDKHSFEIEYKISLGPWRCAYRDVFVLREDETVENFGYVKIAGTPVMKITAVSKSGD